jgi:hypothetical protein
MPESTTTRWQLARGFAALFVVVGLAAAVVYGVVVALDHLRTGVAAGVLTASATVLIAVFSLVGSQRADRRKLIEQSVRERKVPLYDELIRFWVETTNLADELTEDEMIERWREFQRESLHTLVLWMSEPVLAAYNRLRVITLRNAELGTVEGYGLMFAFEDLLLAVRKDLGHSNEGVKRGDLLRLWIEDVDDALAQDSASGGPT